jgi:biopolymer transport protein ExbB
LATAQDEEAAGIIEDLRADAARPLPEAVKALLGVYERVLRSGRTAALLQVPARVPDLGDKVETVRVLRLGLVGGYFAHAATRTSGVLRSEDSRQGAWVADSGGLTRREQSRIAAFLAKPERGGALPFDPTGGAALRAAKASLTLKARLERGGIWLWLIAALAVAAVFVAVERAVALAFLRAGVIRGAKRVPPLLRGGRFEAVKAECAKLGRRPEAVLLQTVLAARSNGSEALALAARDALDHAAAAAHARIGIVRLMAVLSPLVGFLGTAAGIAGAFRAVAGAGAPAPAATASGLADALIPLEAGLAAAVGAMILHGVLGAAADAVAARLEAAALEAVAAAADDRSAPLAVEEPVA